MKNRADALTMITAAMAVAVQYGDLYMSAEIIGDAGEMYGKSFVEDLLTEMVATDLAPDLSVIPKDVLFKRAALSFIRPLPDSWLQVRN